jgi:stage V sporulation protein AA
MDTPPIVYMRLRRRVVVPPESVVSLGQVARLVTDSDRENLLKPIPLYRIGLKDGNMIVIDMLQVVKAVREAFPGTAIEAYGEPQTLVEVASAAVSRPRILMLTLAWLLLFLGSGMALMNFHADVNMPYVQKRITELITGKPERHPWLFQIPYSLGVGLGMLIFFSRLIRKKNSGEPNPLEIEMFMYQESVNHYVITEEYRKRQAREESGERGG